MSNYRFRKEGLRGTGFRVVARNDRRRGASLLLCAALVFVMALGSAGAVFAAPTVASGNPVNPELQFSATGIDMAQDRVLTIWAKESAKIGDSYQEDNFESVSQGEALDNSAKEHVFKLTRITLSGTQTLPAVVANNEATYTPSTTAYIKTEMNQATKENKAVIKFPGPWRRIEGNNEVAVTAGQPQVAWPEMTTGTASLTGADGSFDKSASKLNPFYDEHPDPVYGSSADGYYLITDEGNSGWWVVIELPTLKASAANSVGNDVNYNVVVYAKVKDALKPAFASYVNILNKASDAAATPKSRFADKTLWAQDAVTKGTANTFTAAMTLNGLGELTTINNSAFLGFGYFDEGTGAVTNMAVSNAGDGNAGWFMPNLTVTRNNNKAMTVAGNIDVGVIVSKVDDPASAKYVSLQNFGQPTPSNTGVVFGNANSPLNGLLAYGGSGTGSYAPFNGTNGFVMRIPNLDNQVRPPTGSPNAQANICEAVADAIIDGGTGAAGVGSGGTIVANGSLGALGTTDLSSFNQGLGYTKISDVFGSQSQIKVELAITVKATLTGTEFTGGLTEGEAFKPFLYGTTITRNGLNADDFSTFLPNAVSGGVITDKGLLGAPRYDTYARVYTQSINAVKVDQNGKPLKDAVFALAYKAGDEYIFASNTSSAANGVIWCADSNVLPDATFSNVWTYSSGTDGRVTFDGIVNAANSIYIVELAAPTGYKLLPPTYKDKYAPVNVKTAYLSWDDQANLDPNTAAAGDLMTKVINVPVLALPNTGGPGLAGLLCLGAAMFLASVAIRRRVNRQPLS